MHVARPARLRAGRIRCEIDALDKLPGLHQLTFRFVGPEVFDRLDALPNVDQLSFAFCKTMTDDDFGRVARLAQIRRLDLMGNPVTAAEAETAPDAASDGADGPLSDRDELIWADGTVLVRDDRPVPRRLDRSDPQRLDAWALPQGVPCDEEELVLDLGHRKLLSDGG